MVQDGAIQGVFPTAKQYKQSRSNVQRTVHFLSALTYQFDFIVYIYHKASKSFSIPALQRSWEQELTTIGEFGFVFCRSGKEMATEIEGFSLFLSDAKENNDTQNLGLIKS